jgi:hypothetical protein
MPLLVYIGHRLLACLLTAKILSRINVICTVQPSSQKYTCFRLPQISAITPASHPLNEGRIAIVTDVGMGCGGRGSVGRAIVIAGRA